MDYEDSVRTFTIVDRLPEPMFQRDEENSEISAAFRCQPYIPIAAYKCFVKMALAIMNPEELKHYPQALAWIMTMDHAKHIQHFKGFGCYYHFLPFRYPVPWVTLLRREHADVKLPYMLLLLGTAQVVFQVHLPLCERDDHLIGESVVIPRAAALAIPVDFGEGLANSIRLGSSDVARDTVFDVTIKYDSFAVTDK